MEVNFQNRTWLLRNWLKEKCTSDDEINIRIVKAFNETDDDNHDDDNLNPTQRSIEIPKDNCYILIEPV